MKRPTDEEIGFAVGELVRQLDIWGRALPPTVLAVLKDLRELTARMAANPGPLAELTADDWTKLIGWLEAELAMSDAAGMATTALMAEKLLGAFRRAAAERAQEQSTNPGAGESISGDG